METETLKTLRGLGIASGAILFIGFVAVCFYGYNKILEAQLLKLNIKQAKRDLGIEEGMSAAQKIKTSLSQYVNNGQQRSTTP